MDSRVILIAACVVLEACATTDSYPICAWRQRMTDAEWTSFKTETATFAKLYLGDTSEVAFSENRRVMAAKGPSWSQGKLRSTWPFVGCVGKYEGSERYKEFKVCVMYIERTLANPDVPLLDTEGEYDAPEHKLMCKQ